MGRGWAAAKAPVSAWRMTSDQAPVFWPFISTPALPPTGAQMGIDQLSGGSFYCDPFGWVLRDEVPVTNPNIFAFAKPGTGKSGTTKAFCTRMMPFGYRTLVLGDPKDEYEALCRAHGVEPFVVGPGMITRINPLDRGPLARDWDRLAAVPSVRLAKMLVELGEAQAAGEVLRHQAKIGAPQDHSSIAALAARLNLPDTQLYLAHNGPQGAQPSVVARYPTPAWTPDGGWRVERELVFAHALQESRFRIDAISPAGAHGIMQVLPGTADLIARRRGLGPVDRSLLLRPATNLEFGQARLEQVRDYSATGGLLPKVIAGYNAGPGMLDVWNARVRDNGDPLLFVESIPFWETRGYVATVMRNYWMYQRNVGKPSASLKAMAQGMWPRFPGMTGSVAVRMAPRAPLAAPVQTADASAPELQASGAN